MQIFSNHPDRFLQVSKPVHIAPLAVFRVVFGGVMLASILRFMLKGWVSELYVQPQYYFTYYGFEWVKPLGHTGMHLIFGVMAFTALLIMLGCFYRVAALIFFLSFTYVELIDKTNYLNHYYFVSIVSLMMVLVPAHRFFSLDVLRNPSLRLTSVPRWTIAIFQLQLGIVYFYAGLAKLNPDWMLNAMPLRIWLPANADFPLIGWLFDYTWVAYFFSWGGAVYDLTIPFLLLYRPTRRLAYFLVIGFHVLTYLLFNIGMFPFIMMGATLIFFSEQFHKNLIAMTGRLTGTDLLAVVSPARVKPLWKFPGIEKLVLGLLAIHFVVQLLLPWRFVLYPGELFWTEQGYRFSWRVMLMEKAGMATFTITDPATGHSREIRNSDYLTPNQEKMMSTQPDMILQFAHYLKDICRKQGIQNPEVRVDCHVTVNGRGSRPFIDRKVNLSEQTESFAPKTWILKN